MTENEEATIVVFTARSPERIVREGGSQAWVLNPARAKQCKWLVCTQNRHNPDHEFSDATEPHGSAFLVGKIAALVASHEDDASGRWLIEINEFARISRSGVWDHGRNPVRYTSLSELDIDPDSLEFQQVPSRSQSATAAEPEPQTVPTRLTIAEAKLALAATFGVKPESVEITIHG